MSTAIGSQTWAKLAVGLGHGSVQVEPSRRTWQQTDGQAGEPFLFNDRGEHSILNMTLTSSFWSGLAQEFTSAVMACEILQASTMRTKQLENASHMIQGIWMETSGWSLAGQASNKPLTFYQKSWAIKLSNPGSDF